MEVFGERMKRLVRNYDKVLQLLLLFVQNIRQHETKKFKPILKLSLSM